MVVTGLLVWLPLRQLNSRYRSSELFCTLGHTGIAGWSVCRSYLISGGSGSKSRKINFLKEKNKERLAVFGFSIQIFMYSAEIGKSTISLNDPRIVQRKECIFELYIFIRIFSRLRLKVFLGNIV